MNQKQIVNSWNEWDELEEVIVGIVDNACFDPTEQGSHPKLPLDLFPSHIDCTFVPLLWKPASIN